MRCILRRLGSGGDELQVTDERGLERELRRLEGSCFVALCVQGIARMVGDDPEQVMECVRQEALRGTRELEAILLPRVQGG
ncbi:MAG: hypothetical protein NQU48_03340 [Hadesarchaea archaeon]|jgi:hypothetical protein|nr:hypothetical protein [Hadesarchaea archaeon]TDA33092.1 MAG: hypothetical protein DSO04_01230 [Hadesarchaea archaeon]